MLQRAGRFLDSALTLTTRCEHTRGAGVRARAAWNASHMPDPAFTPTRSIANARAAQGYAHEAAKHASCLPDPVATLTQRVANTLAAEGRARKQLSTRIVPQRRFSHERGAVRIAWRRRHANEIGPARAVSPTRCNTNAARCEHPGGTGVCTKTARRGSRFSDSAF